MVKGVLAWLTAVGVMATLAGGVLGAGLGNPRAGAAPVGVVAGTLGVGERTAAPLDTTRQADSKIAVGRAAAATTLVTPVALKKAPIPKPKPKVVKKRVAKPAAKTTSSTTGKSAVSRATGTGWKSARVSWYGPGFYGNTMAGGGKLTRSSMVVAHRSMAFGTRIQFSYKGRTCTAVVQDRGPFVGGRVFDLGPGTAKALGFSGVGTVKYRIIGR
jgi:rare lipoprotein A (peptidoglycan hydrolase)